MAQVFISYAHADEVRVKALIQYKWPDYAERCFYADVSMRQADVFETRILGEIASCEQLFVYCSPAAAKSDWVAKEMAGRVCAGRPWASRAASST